MRARFYLTIFFAARATLMLYAFDAAQDQVRAKELYYQGVDGDKAATKESTRLLEALAAQKPEDAVTAAYLASNRLLESGRTFALWNKNRLAKEGIGGLDRAVSMAPGNVEVRFIRAVSTWDLPSFFRRQQQSEDDLAWLASRVRPAAEAGRLERELAATALYYHGLALERRGDKTAATTVWKTTVDFSPSTKAGMAAASKLR